MPMTPRDALWHVLHDMRVACDQDADEVIDELHRLGFKIVPDDLPEKVLTQTHE